MLFKKTEVLFSIISILFKKYTNTYIEKGLEILQKVIRALVDGIMDDLNFFFVFFYI